MLFGGGGKKVIRISKLKVNNNQKIKL